MTLKCRVCKTKLVKEYGVYKNMDEELRHYCFICWKRYYVYCRENKSYFSSVIEV
jgi:hypothetical protein